MQEIEVTNSSSRLSRAQSAAVANTRFIPIINKLPCESERARLHKSAGCDNPKKRIWRRGVQKEKRRAMIFAAGRPRNLLAPPATSNAKLSHKECDNSGESLTFAESSMRRALITHATAFILGGFNYAVRPTLFFRRGGGHRKLDAGYHMHAHTKSRDLRSPRLISITRNVHPYCHTKQ